jgi:16S rRNA (cytidine1402-2'-O)-methyltransferase
MVNPSENHSPNHFVSGLYLVATPIGNLQDMTLRGLALLKKADLIACEDTRTSGKLLSYFGIKAQLISYNDHNASRRRDKILNTLAENKIVALISDAGMPLISDPGYKLIVDVTQAGYYVSSMPGASAPLMALQLSALPSDKFCFLGFVPNKQKARDGLFQDWKAVPGTLIAFEAAPRLLATLKSISKVLGNRKMAIARELTKRFEDVQREHVDAHIERIEKDGPPKGEIVLVISGPSDSDEEAFGEAEINSALHEHLKSHSLREAVDIVSALSGEKRKTVYQYALEIKQSQDE